VLSPERVEGEAVRFLIYFNEPGFDVISG